MLREHISRLLGNLRSRFLLPLLIWLAIRGKSFVFNRSLKLQLQLFRKLKYQLRLSDPTSRSEGYDERFDKAVHIAAFRLSNPEIFDLEANQFLFEGYADSLIQKYLEINQEYEKYKADVERLIDNALKNPRTRATVEMYFLVNNFSSIQRKNDRATSYYITQAKRYNPDARVIDIKHLFELEEQSRKEVRELKHEISDRESIKIAFSLERIGVLLSVVSTFFLLSGYLYNNFLLGHFGIEVSKYFTLSDYLASSIEGVRYSASGATIGLVFYFIGMHSVSRMSYAQFEVERKRKDYWPYLMLVMAIAAAFRFHLDDSEQFYSFAYLSILLITLIVAPWISNHYFKEPIVALFSIVFTISFSAHMYESIGKEIHRFEHKSIEELKRYEISFKGRLPFEPSSAVLIAANSTYLFLLDVNRNIYIVPREHINYVIPHRKPNNSLHPLKEQ